MNWTAQANQPWISVSPASGSSNATLSIQVLANPAAALRNGSVDIVGGDGSSVNLAIQQDGFDGNLAKGRPTTASSSESSTYSAANATDGNSTTRWSSSFLDNQWLRVDLADSYVINQIQIVWEAAYATVYTIQFSPDGVTWATGYSTSSGHGGTETIPVSGTARYVRLNGIARATAYGFSIFEFRVFGSPSPQLSLDKSSISVPSTGGSESITVGSNLSWSVINVPTWLTVSPLSGTNSGTIAVQAMANSGVQRVAVVNVDGGGISRAVSVTQAAPINTPPTISAIPSQATMLNAPTIAIPFIIGDAETPVANLTLVASSNNPTLVVPASIVFGGSGANRTVTVTPAAGQSGAATISVQVTDSNGLSASTSFTVTVEAPVRNFMLDRNSDGVSDVWAALYPNAGGPNADPDGDGISNLAEAQAGTDPTNPASCFIATVGHDNSGNLIVRWPSVSGKYYFLESSIDLATWTSIAGDYSGTGSELIAIVRPPGFVAGPRTFWRVVVFDVDSTGSGLNDWETTHTDVVAFVTASGATNGSINPAGVSYSAKGGSLTYSVIAAPAYTVEQVQVDGQAVGAVTTYSFTNLTPGPHTIGASFKRTTTDLTVQNIEGSSAIWPAVNATDGNAQTCWSSQVHGSGQSTEWISFGFNGINPVNFIKLKPRYAGAALGFPVQFSVSWYDGANWQQSFSQTNFPIPGSDDWIIFPLPTTINASGIRITAAQLGKDDVGNFVFQLAEVGAGYDSGYEQFRFVGSGGRTREIQIQNAGSGDFASSKIGNWNFDVRRPLIAANPGSNSNIYAPTIVFNGAWNIYFGGWDGTGDGHDRISITTTSDNFQSFSPHYLMINNGTYNHVNNPSAIRLSTSDWRLYYTTLANENNTNKPAVATGTNGIDWSPNSGTGAARIAMTGYPNWANADVNGSNVVLYENAKFYLYFTDFNLGALPGAFCATSTDGINFTYNGMFISGALVTNDVKSFPVQSAHAYLAGFHLNGPNIYYSLSASPTQFPQAKLLFSHADAGDAFITSVGFVSDGRRLYGALYGAGADSSLTHNAIYAAWLQKKVIFSNSRVRWGDSEGAFGPDLINMSMSSDLETGRFYVYDTDGTTLLYTSPLLTVRSGDIWRYSP